MAILGICYPENQVSFMRAMPAWYEKYSISHYRGLENASTAYTNFFKSIAAFT
jgi:hypothetical protein